MEESRELSKRVCLSKGEECLGADRVGKARCRAGKRYLFPAPDSIMKGSDWVCPWSRPSNVMLCHTASLMVARALVSIL